MTFYAVPSTMTNRPTKSSKDAKFNMYLNLILINMFLYSMYQCFKALPELDQVNEGWYLFSHSLLTPILKFWHHSETF